MAKTKTKTKPMKIDLDNIDPKDLEKLVNRRNHSFSIHTRKAFADAWREAAEREGVKLREWVENVLNGAAAGEFLVRFPMAPAAKKKR